MVVVEVVVVWLVRQYFIKSTVHEKGMTVNEKHNTGALTKLITQAIRQCRNAAILPQTQLGKEVKHSVCAPNSAQIQCFSFLFIDYLFTGTFTLFHSVFNMM